MLIKRAGALTPIHDLFGKSFVLIAGSDGRIWSDAAAELGRRSKIDLPCIRIGPGGDAEERFQRAYGWVWTVRFSSGPMGSSRGDRPAASPTPWLNCFGYWAPCHSGWRSPPAKPQMNTRKKIAR